jgi:CDP-paratose 2-epimerase
MGNSLSLIELFAQLDGLLDAPAGGGLRYERLPRRQSDQDVFVADIRKAERLMDWKPRVAAGEGLRRMLSWTAERLRAE